MAPSLSAIERGNPPPRQKSCVACTRSKRRCNLAQPACVRCSQRKIACRYPSERPASSSARALVDRASGSVASAASPRGGVARDNISDPCVNEPAALLLPTGQTVVVPASVDPLCGSMDTGNGLLAGDPCSIDGTGFLLFDTDITTTATTATTNTTNTITALDGFSPAPPSAFPGSGGLDAVEAFMDLIPRFPLTTAKSNTLDPFQTLLSRRLKYAWSQILRAPQQMAYENSMPWCHHELYADAMPRAMQDAQACCALHHAKNPLNSAAVNRTIAGRVHDLIATPLAADAGPLESIARTQALLLYHIMRLFDSDIAERASAEQTLPHLETAALQLLEHIQLGAESHQPDTTADSLVATAAAAATTTTATTTTVIELQLYPLAATHDFWRAWVFQESARRTFMIVFFVAQLYRLLNRHMLARIHCDSKMYMFYAWTVQAHLWNATDAVEFAVAWRDRKRFVVTNDVLPGVLAEAEAGDIDSYGRILLSSLVGIDELKGWFISKGSQL